MATDHQVREQPPPHAWRNAGMVITVVVIMAVAAVVVWLVR